MSLMSRYFAITHAHWVRCFVKRVWNSNSNSTITEYRRLPNIDILKLKLNYLQRCLVTLGYAV